MDPIRRLIQNWCEILIEPAQGGKNGQQGLGRCRFDDQPVSFLAHDGVLTGEFELPRNPHSPVSPILKDLHVSFGCDYSSWHMSQPMPLLGLCQWRTMVQITQVSMTVTPRICERWFWREDFHNPILLGSDPLLPKIGVSRGLTTRAHRVYGLS